MVREKNRLSPEELAKRYDPNKFPFQTTAEIDRLEAEMIGQERAVKAMDFGLNVKQEGYNLFLVGPSGTGKTTYALSKIKELALSDETPTDWVYVYNFQNPDKPTAISLPPGEGVKFQKEMDELIQDIKTEVEKVITSKEFAQKKEDMINEHEDAINNEWQELNDLAYKQRFYIERSADGVMAIPLNDKDEPYTDDSFRKLSKEEQQEILDKSKEINKKLADLIRKTQLLDRNLRKAIKEMEENTVYHAIHFYIEQMLEKYRDYPKIIDYLQCVEKDVIENWREFHEQTDADEEMNLLALFSQKEHKDDTRYQVNLFIDHSETKGAPVYFESNPTYSNLFGKLEYKSEFGSLVTNFTMIKPGAMHVANGGYVIIQASDLLSYPMAWHALKRMLKTREIRIENVIEDSGTVASSLKPEPIPVQLKIVLIGTYDIYHLLNHYDENFNKYFKVKVDFDTEMERNDEHCMKYASFVASYCKRQNLKHFTNRALARVIDYSTRLSSDQRKLSTRFHEVTEMLVEANYWAEKDGAEYVDANHVKKALKEKFFRSNLIEEKIKASIEDGTIMIQTSGYAVGQINGLSVLNTGDYTFGQPNKITARTFIGSKGIVNIDRESYLSGPLHSKGLLILSGYIQGEFAKDYPIPLAASITFEQSYDLIDGDSASSTELYAILSSLSEIPINQGIAVTGSVNQLGEIQPIGGVNEKIEGFFYTCKAKGLTGEQGVIIPVQNVKNLMLRNEVIEAVRRGVFHIWAVKTIQEGIEILTGVEAGEKGENGNYPPNTVFGRVKKRLQEMSRIYRRQKEKDERRD